MYWDIKLMESRCGGSSDTSSCRNIALDSRHCSVSVPNTEIQCSIRGGSGNKLQWKVIVDGQASEVWTPILPVKEEIRNNFRPLQDQKLKLLMM